MMKFLTCLPFLFNTAIDQIFIRKFFAVKLIHKRPALLIAILFAINRMNKFHYFIFD